MTREGRLNRERRTIQYMVEIYYRGHNRSNDALFTEGQQLLTYAMQRIDKCPFQDDKPTCAKCPVHCYKPGMREKVCQVMRYAGPRMLIYHPVLTILHFVDELTKTRQTRVDKKRNG